MSWSFRIESSRKDILVNGSIMLRLLKSLISCPTCHSHIERITMIWTLQARCRSIQSFAIPLQVISTSRSYLPVLVKTIGKRPGNLTTSHNFSKQSRLSVLEEQWNMLNKKNSLCRLWWWNGIHATHWANWQSTICWSQSLVMNRKRNALNGRWRWRYIRANISKPFAMGRQNSWKTSVFDSEGINLPDSCCQLVTNLFGCVWLDM